MNGIRGGVQGIQTTEGPRRTEKGTVGFEKVRGESSRTCGRMKERWGRERERERSGRVEG